MKTIHTQKFQQLNKRSFRTLFDFHFNALCGFGNKFVAETEVVEDLVQDAFISLWKKRFDFNHEHSVKAYLYTSVKNKCLNHIKKHNPLSRQDESWEILSESEQYVDNAIVEEETFNLLYAEIKSLPKASQAIMLLALNGLKNQEIANELSISVNTVKTQKKIAYAKLKNQLSPVIQAVLINLVFQ